ncbi:MAG: hypothetical protein WCF26_28660 [Candidatus Sulfotelmatobacter sp.]
MGWSIDEIETNFLRGKIDTLALAPEVALPSFERVERLLGREWILSEMTGAGLGPTMRVIGMGLRLAYLEEIDQTEELIKHIRRRDQNADAELTAIYLIRSSRTSAQFQLYPEVGIRKADFRVRDGDEPWTTVEVTQPTTSLEQQRVQNTLRRFTDALSKMDCQFTLEVLFRREPTEEEISVLCDRLPEFCNLEGQKQADLAGELGFLFLNQLPLGQLLNRKIPQLADSPMIGLAMFVGGGQGGGPHHQVSVRIPFTDERAEEILRAEARQLPDQGVGLIMVDVAHASGSFQAWESLIRRRFQPTMHTRVSGICLFEGGMVPTERGYGWLLRTMLITNPHAQRQLPSWIQEAVASAGQEFDRVASSW